MVVWAFYSEKRYSRLWWMSLIVFGGVSFQGALGGLRVLLVDLNLAVVHACLAQAFFCVTISACIYTSRWWITSKPRIEAASRRVVRLAVITVGVIYLQMVAGALMRHFGAGLAIPDLPLAYGHVVPPTNASELAHANQERAYDLNLPPVSLGQIWLHFSHRVGAIVVTGFVLALCGMVFVKHRREKALFRPAILMVVILAIQITLGVLTVIDRKPADIASAHVAVGALLLATAFAMAMRSVHLFPRAVIARTTDERDRYPEPATVAS
jgi:cytochrome c oxidase assembly protein subunit 15